MWTSDLPSPPVADESTRVVRVGAVATALGLSWATMLGHNLYELPLAPTAIENTGPLLVSVMLAIAVLLRPTSRLVSAAILGWALLNLVIGGVVSVLPLPILPFEPEQTLDHYLAHVYYTAGQLPLVLYALTALRRRSGTASRGKRP